jgi:opacity protein-like surface antigen
MIKTFVAVGALAAAVAATPAAAQDWSGGYIGGFAGAQVQDQEENERILFDTNLDGTFGDTVRTTTAADAFSPGFCDGSPKANNAAAGCTGDDEAAGEVGLRAGYDWQRGNLVFGIVGDLSLTNVEDSVSAFSTTPANYAFQREVQGLAAARVRLGYAMGPYLPYVTGGYAVARVANDYSTSNGANSFTPTSNSGEADGFQIGAGIERRLTNSVSVGLEYVYSDLEANDPLVVRTGPGTAPATNPFLIVDPRGTDQIRSSDSIQLHAFRVTGSIRF